MHFGEGSLCRRLPLSAVFERIHTNGLFGQLEKWWDTIGRCYVFSEKVVGALCRVDLRFWNQLLSWTCISVRGLTVRWQVEDLIRTEDTVLYHPEVIWFVCGRNGQGELGNQSTSLDPEQ